MKKKILLSTIIIIILLLTVAIANSYAHVLSKEQKLQYENCPVYQQNGNCINYENECPQQGNNCINYNSQYQNNECIYYNNGCPQQDYNCKYYRNQCPQDNNCSQRGYYRGNRGHGCH